LHYLFLLEDRVFGKEKAQGMAGEAEMQYPPLLPQGAAPAFAGVTSFLRKQELAPRRRGYSVRSSTGGSTFLPRAKIEQVSI
jgi:hypothetical protein